MCKQWRRPALLTPAHQDVFYKRREKSCLASPFCLCSTKSVSPVYTQEQPTFPCLSGAVVQMSSIFSKYRVISLVYRQTIFHIQAEEPHTTCVHRVFALQREKPHLTCLCASIGRMCLMCRETAPLHPPVSLDFTCRCVEKPCLTWPISAL